MSDSISRQAAIDALIEWYGCEPSDLDYFKEIVEKLPSADRPQEWIPCSERMPSDDNDYLVVDGDGEMAVGYYRDDADAWDNCCFGWLEREDKDEHPTRLSKVVAWMPLPKPWKGADDDMH